MVVSVVFADLAGSTDKAEQLDPEGREALRDAGDRAAALYAIEAAERFYDAALRLWPADDPKRAVLLFRRAAPVRHIGGGDPERLMEARDALLKAGRPDEAGEVEMLLSRSFWIRGEHELSEAHTDRRQLAGAGASRRDSPGSGSAARAIADAERALEVVAAISDPQARYFTNALCASRLRRRSTRAGGPAHARGHRRSPASDPAVLRCDRPAGACVDGATAWSPAGTHRRAGETYADPLARGRAPLRRRDYVAAADLLGEIGSKPGEAETRVHAARQLAAAGRDDEAGKQLQQAVAFYRSVGATRYLDEIEPLLTASSAAD